MFASLFFIRLRRGASDNLFALSKFVLDPAYCTLPFAERMEGGEASEVIASCKYFSARHAAINS